MLGELGNANSEDVRSSHLEVLARFGERQKEGSEFRKTIGGQSAAFIQLLRSDVPGRRQVADQALRSLFEPSKVAENANALLHVLESDLTEVRQTAIHLLLHLEKKILDDDPEGAFLEKQDNSLVLLGLLENETSKPGTKCAVLEMLGNIDYSERATDGDKVNIIDRLQDGIIKALQNPDESVLEAAVKLVRPRLSYSQLSS